MVQRIICPKREGKEEGYQGPKMLILFNAVMSAFRSACDVPAFPALMTADILDQTCSKSAFVVVPSLATSCDTNDGVHVILPPAPETPLAMLFNAQVRNACPCCEPKNRESELAFGDDNKGVVKLDAAPATSVPRMVPNIATSRGGTVERALYRTVFVMGGIPGGIDGDKRTKLTSEVATARLGRDCRYANIT